MGSIKTSTGLSSGIDTAALIKAILVNNSNAVSKLQSRLQTVQAAQTGLTQIQAGLLSITVSGQQLGNASTFQALQVDNSDPAQLAVSTNSAAAAGTQTFQAVQLATNHRSISRGIADAGTALGLTGDLVIGTGGRLSRPASLDLLNGGAGVRRGSVRITDRSGATATVDLKNALTVDDVLKAINDQSGISVRAASLGGRIVLEDRTGQSAANLSVADVNGGHAAVDLGISDSVPASTLTGADIYQISEDVPLSVINDGNALRVNSVDDDLSIALRDGSVLEVDLDSARSVGDIVQKINSDSGNGGKLTAALDNGRLKLTDHTVGAGTLSASSLEGSNAARVLGLDAPASADVLTGRSLVGGLNSVLLRNLRGGQGITTPGEISLTDRSGATATVDLSKAESLDDVLAAINTATTAGNVALKLRAQLDSRGTGILVTDTSGLSASNLIIADVGAGTVAADLNIDVDGAVESIASGSLGLRSVNEATSLSRYAPSGGSVSAGSFSITNSAGATAVVNIGAATKTVGDVLDKINAAGIDVTAHLNETGDGFVLVDQSGGAGTLRVQDIGGTPAVGLRLTGNATTGVDGKQRITSRLAQVVHVTAEDTLTTLSTKINSTGGLVRSSVVDSGAAINPYRLSFTSNVAGRSGRLIVDDGALGLNFSDQSVGQDAVLRIGDDPETAFLKSSSSNTFTGAVTGYNVTLLKPGATPAVVTGSPDTDAIGQALNSFVTNYNKLVDQIGTLTKFDPATAARGPLQGNATVQQIPSRVLALVNRLTGTPDAPIRSLADVGVVVSTSGKLKFDPFKFQQAATDHSQDVAKLFTDSKQGFGVKLNAVLEDLNDTETGTLPSAIKADETTAQQLQDQIDRVNSTLSARQAFLELQFANMETLLSGLKTQQDALTALTNLASTSSKSNN